MRITHAGIGVMGYRVLYSPMPLPPLYPPVLPIPPLYPPYPPPKGHVDPNPALACRVHFETFIRTKNNLCMLFVVFLVKMGARGYLVMHTGSVFPLRRSLGANAPQKYDLFDTAAYNFDCGAPCGGKHSSRTFTCFCHLLSQGASIQVDTDLYVLLGPV